MENMFYDEEQIIDEMISESRKLAAYCLALTESFDTMTESASDEAQTKGLFARLEDKIRKFAKKVDMNSANKLKASIDKKLYAFTNKGITKFALPEHVEISFKNSDKLEKEVKKLIAKGDKLIPDDCVSMNEIYVDYVKNIKTYGNNMKVYDRKQLTDMAEKFVDKLEYWLDVFDDISNKLEEAKRNGNIEAGKALTRLAELSSRTVAITYVSLRSFSTQMGKSAKIANPKV